MNKTRKMILTALCAALLCITALIAVPATVPFTLQTFGVYLCYLTLGARGGMAAVAVYLFMGALGLPVFSGGQGGFGVLFGPTGGFLWGFLLMGPVLLPWEKRGTPAQKTAALVLGTVLCYGLGCLWFARVSLGGLHPQALLSAAGAGVLPYILPDGIKLYLACLIWTRLKKAGVLK